MTRLRECREKAGYTQKQVAVILKLSGPSVSNWESGKTNPTHENLARLADLYRVSVDYLMGRDIEETEGTDMTDDEREMWELREAARRDPDRKVLLKLAKNGTAQDVRQAVALIDALRATNSDFYDGDDPA